MADAKREVSFCETTFSSRGDQIVLEIKGRTSGLEETKRMMNKLERVFLEEGFQVKWIPWL